MAGQAKVELVIALRKDKRLASVFGVDCTGPVKRKVRRSQTDWALLPVVERALEIGNSIADLPVHYLLLGSWLSINDSKADEGNGVM